MNRKEDDFDRKLNAALASLPQPRPSAAFGGALLAALARERRAAALPAWPFAAVLSASSTAVAAAALKMTFSIPKLAAFAANAAALLQLAGRSALHLLPDARGGAELSAAAVMAVALFLTLSLPAVPKTRLTGAKS